MQCKRCQGKICSSGRDFNRFSADPPIFVAGQEITLLANFEIKKIDIISYAIKQKYALPAYYLNK